MFTETFEKQYPIALAAIARHMTEHQLPVPHTIEADVDARGEHIVLHLGSKAPALTAWLDTVAIDDEHSTYRDPADGQLEPYLVSVFDVRLPDSGLRLRLRAFRDLPLRLVDDLAAVAR